jgi:hypothetical protein
MARSTVAFGAALVLIGVITYFDTGQESVTALIPVFIGAPVLLAGLVSLRTEWRSYGLYAAAALVLVLALGTLRGTFGLLGGEISPATVINAVLLVASVGYVALCVRDLTAVLIRVDPAADNQRGRRSWPHLLP